MENEFFNDENHNSLKKLSMLKEHLTSKIKEKGLEADFKNLSIYCTGSYGRQEANNNSDMDLLLTSSRHLNIPYVMFWGGGFPR